MHPPTRPSRPTARWSSAARNDSGIGHNLYLLDADGTGRTPAPRPPQRGRTATETAELAPASYTVICKIPGHGAMKSTLTVT